MNGDSLTARLRRFVRLRRIVGLPTSLMLLGALGALPARSQEQPAATYPEWRLLEPAQEMLDYKSRLKEGSFDEASKNFLVNTALPQLALPKNRATIDRIRRRMRDVLSGDAGVDAKAAAAANRVVADFMKALARDDKADTVARVNAMLLVGELRGPDAKPWAPAAAPLAAALGDEALPPAVRIAAAAGLARHVEADPAGRAADAGPTLLAVARAPLAGVDPVAADWLRSRAFAMLARLGTAAPAGTAAAAAQVLFDRARPVDLRVRAAAALGSCIKAAGDVDVAAAVAAIGELATGSVAATKSEIERGELAMRLAAVGQPQQQPQPQRPQPADALDGDRPNQSVRRDAWRLATLATALASADGAGGLARVAGPGAAAANALAKALRDAAAILDASADAAALDAALRSLAVAPAGAPAAGPVGER